MSGTELFPAPATGQLSPYGTKTDVLTTELNSLANGSASAASAAYDNSTTRYPWVDMILSLAVQGSARSAGATVSVFMTPRTDGTNYDTANATTAELVAVFPLDAATTARVRTVRRISLPPENVKFFALNSTGQAFAASANAVSVRPYYDVSS